MSELSEIPPTLGKRDFPYGDINNISCIMRAHAWLEACENLEGDHAQKFGNVSYQINAVTNFWNAPPLSQKVHKDAVSLCDVWDEREHPGEKFVRRGFVAAHSLVIRSHIFPATFADFSTELENMKDPEKTNARSFGAAAWDATRASHPALFTLNFRLNRLLSELHGRPSEEDVELQKAGIGLSTMLGVHSRLARDALYKPYTGVKEGIDATKPLINKPVSDWLER